MGEQSETESPKHTRQHNPKIFAEYPHGT